MALAICLLFDRRSERLVRELWQRCERSGISTLITHTHGRHVPHLSFAILRDGDDEEVREALGRLADDVATEVEVQGTVVFPRGRVALACSVSTDLVSRQERTVARIRSAGADLHRHYEPNRWVPHVSVATGASAGQLPVVVSAISDVLPLTLLCDRLVLVDTATGRQWAVPSAA